jgi:predicted phage terminase large subunit-like protein
MPTKLHVRLPKPHPAQERILHDHERFNVLVCGRRFGKTVLLLNRLVRPALAGQPVAWFAPTEKYFDEVWREAISTLFPVIQRADIQKKRIDLITRGSIDFWTLHNTDDPGRGRKYASVAIDEAAIAPRLERQWTEAIRPTLTDLKGDAWFASTPKGGNYFKQLADRAGDGWRSWQLPTTANPHIDPNEVEAARRELPNAVFRQEFLAEFVTDFGAVFKAATYYDSCERPQNGYQEATGCDFAYTSRSGDWTVFLTGRAKDGVLYVTDLYREQAESTVWAERLKACPSPSAFIGGQEGGIADFLRKDYGIRLDARRAVTDKLARAMPAITAWNRGEIRLPARAPITTVIEGELLAFTGDDRVDAHDDIVDALASLHHTLLGDPTPMPRARLL